MSSRRACIAAMRTLGLPAVAAVSAARLATSRPCRYEPLIHSTTASCSSTPAWRRVSPELLRDGLGAFEVGDDVVGLAERQLRCPSTFMRSESSLARRPGVSSMRREASRPFVKRRSASR